MTGRDAEQDVFGRPATSVSVPPRLPSLGRMDTLASWAEHLVRALLQETLPRRWAHVQGVATRARSLAPLLGADADRLEAAAWLRDIGYAPDLALTGLHALDGARYLRDTQHADAMLCRLVAHHSCAIIDAGERGLADVLRREFKSARRALSSVLTYCDMTTSPDGEPVPVDRRLAEIHQRYGQGHLVSRSIQRATPMAEPAAADVPAIDADVDAGQLIAAQLPQVLVMHDPGHGSQVRSYSREPPRRDQDLGRGQDAHHDSMGTCGAQ